MNIRPTKEQSLALTFASAWNRLERRLDNSLGSIRGVTRALRPMEKLGIVSTLKSKRDARLAIAALTPAGRELLNDASGIVDDTMKGFLERSPKASAGLQEMIDLLDDVGR